MIDTNSLVSVLVVTYNSDEYIYETLESIKAQTYKNIELVLTDDGSSDNTIEIAQKWMDDNHERFVRTRIITVPNNTGVSANYNRGIKECMGLWIKNVDGDDLIMPTCIEDNIDCIKNHPEIEVLFSDMIIFKGDQNNIIGKFSDSDFKGFFELSAQDQFLRLIQRNVLPSVPLFIKTTVIKKYPYNEKYMGVEDFPMWVTLTHNGHKAFYMNKVTALYRKGDSVTSSHKRLYSPFYMDSMELFYKDELAQYLRQYGLDNANSYYRRQFMLYHIAMEKFKNKGSFINRAIFSILRKILNCE